jgi:hypothetical protein
MMNVRIMDKKFDGEALMEYENEENGRGSKEIEICLNM